MMKSFNFTHVLNVTAELPNYFEDRGFEYLKISVNDYETETISLHFKKAYEFIESAKKGKILIHCVLGRSRSFAFLVMYIMVKYGLSFEESNEVVNERRFLGQINLGFQEQLIEFEKKGKVFSDQ